MRPREKEVSQKQVDQMAPLFVFLFVLGFGFVWMFFFVAVVVRVLGLALLSSCRVGFVVSRCLAIDKIVGQKERRM